MQRFHVQPGHVFAGTVRVPGDKSISHRALMLGAVADGETSIKGFLAGEDCLATMSALRALGVRIDANDLGCIRIAGKGMHGLKPAAGPLDMGNSGTGLRLLTGLLAGQLFTTQLTGDASLRSRPMERVAAPLRSMGARVETTNGCAPIAVAGGDLQPLEYHCPVASAQVKSAVLLAGLYAAGTTIVHEPGVTRDHTERMLQTFGAHVTQRERYAAVEGPARLQAGTVQVPGDLSSAAFALGLGCLSNKGPVAVENVGINPTRTGLLKILQLMGAGVELESVAELGAEPVARLVIQPAQLRGAVIPPELIPLAIDELPLVFALAACAEGDTLITGAGELRHKESDRIGIMARGLQALGIEVEEQPDGARIRGGNPTGGVVESAGDHRIAMAFSVLAARAKAPVTILDTANVATSFPGFVGLMQSLGLQITESADA